MKHPIEVLEQFWGFTSFRSQQEEIINAVLNNEDVLALLPTGGGKSICYQIPALIREGICIVVSPLIALMNDQVTALQQKGIKAMAITSKYNYTDVDRMLDNCIYGNYKFLFLSPERIQVRLVQERIKQMYVNLIAVDEAHCISEWGNDFRPAYQKINLLRTLHPSVNVLALTASATTKVQEDIVDQLDFIAPKVFKTSLYRPNLSYAVIQTEDKLQRMIELLKSSKAAIIYLRSRKQTVTLCNELVQNGILSTFYHGGLDNQEREKRFQDWKQNRVKVVVATNAFGMGIDKADVDLVIHASLPESLESYIQEAGRAGRNGLPAKAVIIKNNADQGILKNQFLSVLPSIDHIKRVYRKLNSYFQIAYGEGEHIPFPFQFSEFCRTYELNSLKTYNALEILDRNGIISLSTRAKKQCELQFKCTSDQLFTYYKHQVNQERVIKLLLRTYGGIFEHLVAINLDLMAQKAEVAKDFIIATLNELHEKELAEVKQYKTDAEVVFLVPREDDKVIYRIANTIEQLHASKTTKVNTVINYVSNNDACRNQIILNYFGEHMKDPCGLCDNCKQQKPVSKTTIEVARKEILKALQSAPQTSKELVVNLNLNREITLKILQELLEINKIKILSNNTYTTV